MISLEDARELCTLYWFEDDAWAVVDDDGRYDGGGRSDGDVPSLHWVRGEEHIDLDQLRDHYYDPHLLPKHLGLAEQGGRKLYPRPVTAVNEIEVAPDVHVEAPRVGDTHLDVTVRNRGGGIGRIVILVNGKEVRAIARGEQVAPDAAEARFSHDLAGDSRVIPGRPNVVQVEAYSAEGRLLSRGPVRTWTAPGRAVETQHHLWAVVCGISDYEKDTLDLTYAAEDAERFAEALTLAGTTLLGAEHVHVTLLSTSGRENAEPPDKEHLLAALEGLKKAGPEDIVLVYLAGHGVAETGEKADYYYLLSTANGASPSDPNVRESDVISSAELFGLIQATAPGTGRQVLILDTCASGEAITRFTAARDASGIQERALLRLKDGLGLFVLAGCAANQSSYEASHFGQGLLTWALLWGMQTGEGLEDGDIVDVSTLFNYARKEVPQRAREIGVPQQPVVGIPRGGGVSYPVGRLTAKDRDGIQVNHPRPLLFIQGFQDMEEFSDVLDLGGVIREILQTGSSRGGDVPFYILKAQGPRGAYRLVGRYERDGETVKATARLFQGKKRVGEIQVERPEGKVPELARAIVAAARELVSTRSR